MASVHTGQEEGLLGDMFNRDDCADERICSLDDDNVMKEMNPIPLPEVAAEDFAFIQKWLEKHRNCIPWKEETQCWGNADKDVAKFENEMLSGLLDDQLFSIFKAAFYMDIKSLMEKCAQVVAGQLKGKSEAQIRDLWNLKSDLNVEDKVRYSEENPWEAIMRYKEKNT